MVKWLSSNFKWKILSLAIAIVVWIYINNELSYRASDPYRDLRRQDSSIKIHHYEAWR